MRALLDINVLIALFDEDHTHHVETTGWLEENIDHGWASCPLTQNGCIRIMSQPRYPNASTLLKSSRDCKKQFPQNIIVLSRITSVF